MKKYYKIIVLCILILLFIINTLKSDVVYTDIIPDKNISPPDNSSQSFMIDINGDTENDFYITVNNLGEYSNISISGINKLNEVIGSGSLNEPEYFFPLKIEKNHSIGFDSQGLWFNNWDTEWGHDIPMPIKGYGIIGDGNWNDEGFHYLGVRYNNNNNFYYGWICIKISNDISSAVLSGYAFESVPNRSIEAGVVYSGLKNFNYKSDIFIYPNPSKDVLNMKLPFTYKRKVTLSLFSIEGNKIIQNEIKNINNGTVSLNLSNIKAGIYIVSIDLDGMNLFHKIIIEK